MQTKQNISLHINNCFKDNELQLISVVKNYLTTATFSQLNKNSVENILKSITNFQLS